MSRKFVTIGLVLLASIALAIIFLRDSDEGVTPLMIAAKEGDLSTLKELILKDANLDERSAYGWTALIFASWQGHEDVVRQLVMSGADINLVSGRVPASFSTTSDHPETTALFEAIYNRHLTIAFYLLDEGAVPNAGAMAIAGMNGTPDLLQRMVENGGDVNAISEISYYRSPLSVAAAFGRSDNMKWLLAHGAEPNLPLPHESNLIAAVRGLEAEAVEILLDAGAEADARIGTRKTTALREAIYTSSIDGHGGRIEIVRLLLEAGADPHYLPDDRSRTLIEQVQRGIQSALEGSLGNEQDPHIRARSQRTLEVNRALLEILTAN